MRVERIAAVDERAKFTLAGGGGKQGLDDGGSPGGNGTRDFRDRAARKAFNQRIHRIDVSAYKTTLYLFLKVAFRDEMAGQERVGHGGHCSPFIRLLFCA